MQEQPDIPPEEIIRCLWEEYGLQAERIAFLPLGADQNTAVYRAATNAGMVYFVKLRKGDFTEASVTVPNFLSKLGVRSVIPAIPTRSGQLWANWYPYRVILYPFVEGRNGFAAKMSLQQWAAFGVALQQFHTARFPSALTSAIPRENFSPHWRDTAKIFLARVETELFTEPVAAALAEFLKIHREETLALIDRAERYAQLLQDQPPPFILCHADIHGWNLLIDAAGALYMVDWDTLIFAPKERDLMFIGGGPGDSGYPPGEEEAMFYQGYGPVSINPMIMAYYRYERIIEDIAVYCEQVFLSDAGGKDRKQSLENVKSNFLPNGTIERACQAERIAFGGLPAVPPAVAERNQ